MAQATACTSAAEQIQQSADAELRDRSTIVPAPLSVVHPSLHRRVLRDSSVHSFQRLPYRPAAGIRNTSSGALTNVGTNGYAWSSSPAASGSVYAGMMNFNSGNVNTLNTDANRGHARAVRCVQHLQRLFSDRRALRQPQICGSDTAPFPVFLHENRSQGNDFFLFMSKISYIYTRLNTNRPTTLKPHAI